MTVREIRETLTHRHGRAWTNRPSTSALLFSALANHCSSLKFPSDECGQRCCRTHPHSLRDDLQSERSVDRVRYPRAWSCEPCARETVEKASLLTKEHRMESSVASPCRGPWGYSRGRSARLRSPSSRTPQWSAVRRAGLARPARAPSQGHAQYQLRPYGAPLPLLRSKDALRSLWGANREEPL